MKNKKHNNLLKKPNQSSKQKGTALITGLVLLTVMTIVSVSTIESSIVQTTLSTNAEHKAVAFQEAEAALKLASSPTNLLAAMNDVNGKKNIRYQNYEEDDDHLTTLASDEKGKLEAEANVVYCGILPSGSIKGMSLNANVATNASKKYVRYIFDISSTVNLIEGRQTQSKHSQRNGRLMMGSSGVIGDTCG